MEFLALFKLLHIFAISLGALACAMLMLRLCAGGSPALGRWQFMRNLRVFSYAMLTGLLLLAFSAGGLFSYSLLATSSLPPNEFMILRIASLVSMSLCTALLHVYVIPWQVPNANVPAAAERPLTHTAALALAASAILVSWVMWGLSGLPEGAVHGLSVSGVMAGAAGLIVIIWCLLAATVIANRFASKLLVPPHVAIPVNGALAKTTPVAVATAGRLAQPRPTRFRSLAAVPQRTGHLLAPVEGGAAAGNVRGRQQVDVAVVAFPAGIAAPHER